MNKDLKHLYFELLEFLSDKGVGIDVDVKPICVKYFIKSKKEDVIFDKWTESINKVIFVLDTFQRTGYIKYPLEYDLQELYLTNGVFNVSITKSGLDYYYNHVLRLATIKSFKTQGFYNTIAITIAIGSLITTIILGIRSNREKDLLPAKIDSLNKEVRLLKAKQHSMDAIHKTPDSVLKKK